MRSQERCEQELSVLYINTQGKRGNQGYEQVQCCSFDYWQYADTFNEVLLKEQ